MLSILKQPHSQIFSSDPRATALQMTSWREAAAEAPATNQPIEGPLVVHEESEEYLSHGELIKYCPKVMDFLLWFLKVKTLAPIMIKGYRAKLIPSTIWRSGIWVPIKTSLASLPFVLSQPGGCSHFPLWDSKSVQRLICLYLSKACCV